MVARGGAAQQRNPGKEENIYWNPVEGWHNARLQYLLMFSLQYHR